MAIDLKKILTISPKEWSEISGRNLRDYNIEGIHHSTTYSEGPMIFLAEGFSKKVPDEAEVVVDYRYIATNKGTSQKFFVDAYATGTALIPKKDLDDRDIGKDD